MFKRRRDPSPARRSASDDWVAALPREKSQVFEKIVRGWECSYAMMSVSLDEAIALRARGELVCAQQQVSITTELLRRLIGSLTSACSTLASRGKHVTKLPIVQPLMSGFFRGDTAQSAASWNSLLHNVLFGERSRFFHKLRILSTTFEQLGAEFNRTADEIIAGTSVEPGACWKHLESLHYDLSTCLGESEVMLKSFLHCLPSDQLSSFDRDMSLPPVAPKVRTRTRATRATA